MIDSSALPVTAALPALCAALREQGRAVLVAPPGAGKSTVVPLALLQEPWAPSGPILMLEPRRLATRAVAMRMAESLGERVGETVGYRMRLESRVSARTRLIVLTEGLLTRMLQDDPTLNGATAVIFDEFHERSLAADLGLALAIEARQTVSPDLRLLAMSATLDTSAVAAALNNAPIIRAEGRRFPVDVHFVGQGLPALPAVDRPLPLESCVSAVRRAVQDAEGDILVFLPGAPEIHRLQRMLEEARVCDGIVIHKLFGEQDGELQQQALTPDAAGRRKLILSTNVAETSLTIEGVRVVIDLGLARRALFDPNTGMSHLATVRISRSSAEQRAGRAGRTASGTVFRLWSEGTQASLAPQTPPEILHADLTPLALELAAWGARDASALAFLDAPPAATLAQARDLLQRLNAVDSEFKMTSEGRAMLTTGLHPRLAHMLVRARDIQQAALAAQLAALLSERDLLRGQSGHGRRDADLRTRLELLRRQSTGSSSQLDRGALQRVQQLASRLANRTIGQVDDSAAGALLAWAFPDRIAQRRVGKESGRYLLSNGRGAILEGASTLANSEYLVVVELDDADGATAKIRLAVPITLEQIESSLVANIRDTEETDRDPATGALRSRRLRRLDALVLQERRVEVAAEDRAQWLLDEIKRDGLKSLPWGEQANTLRARVTLLYAQSLRETRDWPVFDDATLLDDRDRWLLPALHGKSRLDQLSDAALHEALLSRLSHAQRRQFEALAPLQVVVPTGSRITVDYLDESAPCIEVRMQEVFGLADTPRIAGGRVPITLKLLSPARRPMQITRDLAGFWCGSYADVRKDMRGRYPRHYWPENPLEAEPLRGLKPRKK